MKSISDFAQGADVAFQKSKIMKTYNAIKIRMQSRFTKNGVLSAKLFLVSSKKSDQDFIEQYVETVKNDSNTLIVDKAQWDIKPPGTFSDKRFKIAVGNKKIKSKFVSKDDDIEALKKQGYEIIEVPLELKRYFERDMERALMDLAGISTSLVSKFISYDSVRNCYTRNKNPFSNSIISIGTNDDLLIQDFFNSELVDERLYTKPIFIHLDMSLTGDRTGISAVASVGVKEEFLYIDGEMTPIQELVYAHLFSVGIQCPAGAEISLEKNRQFIYYLKYNLGWNIQGLSMDGYQSADSKQQFIQSGFDARILSLDRTPDGYLYLKASLNEKRIGLLEIEELEKELINLERNNMSGKVDHPVNGSKDIADSLAGALKNASENTIKEELYSYDDLNTIYESNQIESKFDDNIVMKNLETSVMKSGEQIKPEISLKQAIDDEINLLLNTSDKKSEAREKRNQERLKEMKKNLTPEERRIVSDEELENAFYASQMDDDILIW